MKKVKLLLSLPDDWHDKLEEVRQKYYFTSLQEVVYDLIRKEYFINDAPEKTLKIRKNKIIKRKK